MVAVIRSDRSAPGGVCGRWSRQPAEGWSLAGRRSTSNVARETRPIFDVSHPVATGPDGGQADAGPGGGAALPDDRSRDSVPEHQGRAADDGHAEVLAGLHGVVDDLVGMDLDDVDDPGLRRLLAGVQRQIDRLGAVRDRLVGTIELRAVRDAGVGREAHARREARREVRDSLQLTGSEAKRAGEVGAAMQRLPVVRAAYEAGRIRPEQAQVVVRALQQLVGSAHDRVQEELLEAARRQDAVALGRTARRLLAREDVDNAARTAERDRRRRRFSMTQTPHGSVAFSGELYGLAAERLMTAVHGFARPDDPGGTRRTSEQRMADAFDEVLIAALERGTAPTDHGARPQVHVTIPWEVIERGSGCAEALYTGPILYDELRSILNDVSVCRILLDARSVPIEVSEMVRTVPAGLWRALVQRDGGCRWPGCDAPPGFCDVAHGTIAWADGGRLRLEDSVLLCRTHHRRFDAGGWDLEISGRQVRFRRR